MFMRLRIVKERLKIIPYFFRPESKDGVQALPAASEQAELARHLLEIRKVIERLRD
jgi:hypothetical protein